MKNLNMAWRSLFKKGRNNLIKILSLGIGLALGLVLIAKVHFEQTYDNFYPDGERLYRIYIDGTTPNGFRESSHISGGVAVTMKNDIPEMEATTRLTELEENAVLFTQDKKRLSGTVCLADSCLFDVLPRPMVIGNAKEALSRPMYALVSRSMAENIGHGNDVVGSTFTLDVYPSETLTIGGVFEDVPENSTVRYDVLISMSSISRFMWDGSMNYNGNDRYWGYVKLVPGVDPASVFPAMRRTQEKHMDLKGMQEGGYDLRYFLRPLQAIHGNDPDVKRMSLMLALLAFALLFTASMNYILIVVSSMVGRSKEVAVQKCYGASGKNISSLILAETLLHTLLALGLAALLILAFRGTVEQITGTTLGALFTGQSCLILLGVVVMIFLLTGVAPSYLFSKIPVASALRNYRDSKRNWKRVLLFVQFSAATFLVTLMIIIGKQYNLMINDDPGYDYRNVLYCQTGGIEPSVRQKALDELDRLAFVEQTATCETLPILGASGNNVRKIGESDLFNYADLYGIDADYLPLMKIPVIEGKNFSSENADSTQAIVSRAFADKLCLLLGWQDGVVGKSLQFTAHGHSALICGVYENIRVGSIHTLDPRPSAMFYSKTPRENLMIRLNELKPEYIGQITEIIAGLMPDKDIQVVPYKAEVTEQYASSKLFRNTVLIGSLLTLLISLIGLIGYTQDETSRRSKEIAIRKVNGATAPGIVRIIARDVVLMALPAAVVGVVCSYFTSESWLAKFAEKVPLSALLFLTGTLTVLVIVTGCVVLKTWRIANENPVQSLKRE